MRLFVAFELDHAVRSLLTQRQKALAAHDRTVRWTKPEQMHLTLKFIGEVEDKRLPDISSALQAACADSAPFDLKVAGCGCFPPRGAVRIVWAGAQDETNALERCFKNIEAHCENAAVPRETKPFSPHLTIGRVREDRTGGRLRSDVEAVSLPTALQHIDEMVLMQSELRREGALHTRMGTWKLGG